MYNNVSVSRSFRDLSWLQPDVDTHSMDTHMINCGSVSTHQQHRAISDLWLVYIYLEGSMWPFDLHHSASSHIV